MNLNKAYYCVCNEHGRSHTHTRSHAHKLKAKTITRKCENICGATNATHNNEDNDDE